MKYWSELTPKQQEQAIGKINKVDNLPLFASLAKENSETIRHLLASSGKAYAFDNELTCYPTGQ